MSTTHKLAIGIPTYNRINLVRMNAASLCRADKPSACDILVVDDCSSSFDSAFLASIYPRGTEILVRESKSEGADFAIYDVMKILFDRGYETIMLLDSDFVVRSDFLEMVLNFVPQTEGLLSLFNTLSHPVDEQRGEFVIKKTIGSAATVWRRDLAGDVLANVPRGRDWDWRFCDFLSRTGRNIFVTRKSLAQHVGYLTGQNSRMGMGDIGLGFSDVTIENAYSLIEIIMFHMRSEARKGLRQAKLLSSTPKDRREGPKVPGSRNE